MKNSAIDTYLSHRALGEPWRIDGCTRDDFAAAVVIPSLAEGENLRATLAALATNPAPLLAQTLILVVVNQRRDAAAADRDANAADLRWLREAAPALQPLQLAWVDAAGDDRELPVKGGGVGLARRIGLDLALARLDRRQPRPFLVCLDADTLVQADYLPALFAHFREKAAAGAVLPFAHQPAADPAAQRAIDRYELFLRHYVLGLELAGSPYAYLSVGSALACRADAYARAGGMNRRPAGEDFYFLQQLAKVGGVAPLRGTLVHPSPRPSSRTPFGTGRSVARLLAGEEAAVSFYHPDCFRILGRWLARVATGLNDSGPVLREAAAGIAPELADYLTDRDFVGAWERLCRNHRTPAARHKAFHDWFDGLVSLRLIHHLGSGARARCTPESALPPLLAWAQLPTPAALAGQLRVLRCRQNAGVAPGTDRSAVVAGVAAKDCPGDRSSL